MFLHILISFERFFMFSFSKNGAFRKSGAALVGVAVLGSLMLTACSPAAQTNDSAPNPTAAPATSTSAAPAMEFQSETFDESKQSSFIIKTDDRNRYLSNGVVTVEGKGDEKLKFTLTPYENPNDKWEYTTETPLKDGKADLMRWKDKSYLVVDGVSVVKEASSGLAAEKSTETEIVVVLDVMTGKVVNTIKGNPKEIVGGMVQSDNTKALKLVNNGVVTSSNTTPLMTGLVFGNGAITKLVDPLTGQEVATDTEQLQHYNEAGFYKLSDVFPAKNYGYEGTNLVAESGNYILVSNNPRNTNIQGSVAEYRLVNTLTKEVSPEILCVPQTKRNANGTVSGNVITYSPDFRYVNFFENTVFDTKTGKSFCTQPAGKPEVRPFVVTHINNNGDMFGATTSGNDLLKVSLADSSAKAQNWAPNTNQDSIITDKGSLVVKISKTSSEQQLVVLPAKN